MFYSLCFLKHYISTRMSQECIKTHFKNFKFIVVSISYIGTFEKQH